MKLIPFAKLNVEFVRLYLHIAFSSVVIVSVVDSDVILPFGE